MKNIILLHGALGSSNDLIKLSESFKVLNIYPHIFSFSGHGEKDFETEFTISQFADELKEFISDKQLFGSTILGYSMGGYVALYLASLQLINTGSIITLGTKFNWSKETVDNETKMLVPDLIKAKIPNFANSLQSKHGDKWQEIVLKTAELMKDIHAKNYLNDTALKLIQNNVLIGLSDRDQMVSYEETRQVFNTLQKANMYILPNGKHSIESIDINLLANIVLNFLNKK